jgi:hypothetical protein
MNFFEYIKLLLSEKYNINLFSIDQKLINNFLSNNNLTNLTILDDKIYYKNDIIDLTSSRIIDLTSSPRGKSYIYLNIGKLIIYIFKYYNAKYI